MLDGSDKAKDSSAPFGVLYASFKCTGVPREVSRRMYELARGLATYGNLRKLKDHADAVVGMLTCQPSTLDSVDSASTVGAAKEHNAEDFWSEEDSESDEDDHPSFATDTMWMTFKDATLEKEYVNWAAIHLRSLDPAAALFCSVLFLSIGFFSSWALFWSHPFVWSGGWAALLPALLCLLPFTSNWYLQRREHCLCTFNICSLAWQTWTTNGVAVVGPHLYTIFKDVTPVRFSWQIVNLLMFQASSWYCIVSH